MPEQTYYGITVYSDEALDQTITVQDSAGDPVNLSGYCATCDVRDLDGNLKLRLSSGPSAGQGTLTLGGMAGTVRFTATQSLIDAMGTGYFVYDLLLVNGSSVPSNDVTGVFLVEPGATTA